MCNHLVVGLVMVLEHNLCAVLSAPLVRQSRRNITWFPVSDEVPHTVPWGSLQGAYDVSQKHHELAICGVISNRRNYKWTVWVWSVLVNFSANMSELRDTQKLVKYSFWVSLWVLVEDLGVHWLRKIYPYWMCIGSSLLAERPRGIGKNNSRPPFPSLPSSLSSSLSLSLS